jgi:hypothetical protein
MWHMLGSANIRVVSDEGELVSSEVDKIFGDTPTNVLYPWYFGIDSNILVPNNMSGKFTQNAVNLMNALLYS